MRRSLSILTLLGACAAAKEVGSRTCAPCHREIYERYMASPMARSSGPVRPGSFIESFERTQIAAGAVKYSVAKLSDGLAFAFSDDGVQGSRRLHFFVGSGGVGRSYLSFVDGFLFQAPVSYYSNAKRWDLSPGFEKSPEINLLRAAEPGCLRCHASRIQHVEGTTNGYSQPVFLEGGVSCERCHGPGEAHIAKPAAGTIINPVKLTAARRNDVCAQCHLSGAVEIGKAGEYTPGGVLKDHSIAFQWSGAADSMPVISHFERMTQSACFRGSSDALWCGTCHNPHSPAAAQDKVAYFRARCLTCHTDASCKAEKAAQIRARNNCVQCHMPRTGVATVRHAAFTDHSIPRIPRPAATSPVPLDAMLVPFGDAKPGDRELGLAYAEIAIKDSNRIWGMRALDLLTKAFALNSRDGKVASQLAQLYDRMRQEEKACEMYRVAVASDPALAASKVNLGACLAKEGKLQEAMRLWEDALRRSPGTESARLNLAVAQHRSGNVTAARSTLADALRINPASRRARQMLAEIGSGP